MGNKLVIFSCAIVAVLGLAGCSGQNSQETGSIDNATAQSSPATSINEPSTSENVPTESVPYNSLVVEELNQEDAQALSQNFHNKLKLLSWNDTQKQEIIVEHFFGYDYHLKPIYALNLSFPEYTVTTTTKETAPVSDGQKAYSKYIFDITSSSGEKLATVSAYWVDDMDDFKVVDVHLSDYAKPRLSPAIIES